MASTIPPPTSGSLAYNSFKPGASGFPAVGKSYTDPAFRSIVTRLTDDTGRASDSDIYGRNGFWSATGKYFWHHPPQAAGAIIETATGRVVRSNVPGNFDGSFSPVDDDVWYWFDGARLMAYSVRSGQSSTVKAFQSTLGKLGGSNDWLSADGRVWCLSIAGRVRVFIDGNEVTGSIAYDLGAGWASVSPDGEWLVINDDREGPGHHKHLVFDIDRANHRLNTNGRNVWSKGGGHSDLISCSNRRSYLIAPESYDQTGVWKIDLATGEAARLLDVRAPNNHNGWFDNDGHISCSAKSDWAFTSRETRPWPEPPYPGDPFNGGVQQWAPYRSEIIAMNVVTGEVRRLAHHRSRSLDVDYRYQPRICADWRGRLVGWASNMNQASPTGYVDLYFAAFDPGGGEGGGEPEPTPPPDPEYVTLEVRTVLTNREAGASVTFRSNERVPKEALRRLLG